MRRESLTKTDSLIPTKSIKEFDIPEDKLMKTFTKEELQHMEDRMTKGQEDDQHRRRSI